MRPQLESTQVTPHTGRYFTIATDLLITARKGKKGLCIPGREPSIDRDKKNNTIRVEDIRKGVYHTAVTTSLRAERSSKGSVLTLHSCRDTAAADSR